MKRAPTRRLILSWAPPHQSGNGHVNPRAPGYVLQAFAAYGWRPQAAETAALRRASALPWYRANAFSFSLTLLRTRPHRHHTQRTHHRHPMPARATAPRRAGTGR